MDQNTEYHDVCPVCDVQFIGATSADVVEHIIEEHPDIRDHLASMLGIPEINVEECEECEREFVTYRGSCPWCR